MAKKSEWFRMPLDGTQPGLNDDQAVELLYRHGMIEPILASNVNWADPNIWQYRVIRNDLSESVSEYRSIENSGETQGDEDLALFLDQARSAISDRLISVLISGDGFNVEWNDIYFSCKTGEEVKGIIEAIKLLERYHLDE